MSGVQKSTTVFRSASCGDEFGLGLAGRWFGLSAEEIEAKAGRFTKGKNKGKLRGWIVWRKVEIGGWNYGLQSVLRPGMIFAIFAKTYDELCDLGGKAPSEFISIATRVDSAYGHSPRPAVPADSNNPPGL